MSTKAKQFLNESGNAKEVIADYIKQLNKVSVAIKRESQVLTAEVEKVVAELGKQGNFDKVSKIISPLTDIGSDLAFEAKQLRTLLLDLEAED